MDKLDDLEANEMKIIEKSKQELYDQTKNATRRINILENSIRDIRERSAKIEKLTGRKVVPNLDFKEKVAQIRAQVRHELLPKDSKAHLKPQ